MPYGIQPSKKIAHVMRPWLVVSIAAGMITGTAVATELGLEQDPITKLLFGELSYTGASPRFDLALILALTGVLSVIFFVDLAKSWRNEERWYPPAEPSHRTS